MTQTKTIMYLDLNSHIKTYRDFPRPGILYYDILPLLAHPARLQATLKQLLHTLEQTTWQADFIVAPEARGFLLGALIAQSTNRGLIPIRKTGKLPGASYSLPYTLEYGQGQLEIQKDVIKPNQKVILVDDVLATGGTAKACIELCQRAQAIVVGVLFLIELPNLAGRQHCEPIAVNSVLKL